MKQTAVVVRREGRLVAEVRRVEACGNCRGCALGAQDLVHLELPPGNYEEGQMVELELSDARFSIASLIAYGVPVAAFFAGLFIARAFTDADGIQALAALAALALSFLAIKIYDRRIKVNGRYAPSVRACRESGGEHGRGKDT